MNNDAIDIPDNCTVAIVGGGTAGLALAAELKRLGVGDIVVLERESEAGGAPRHCGHYPFGVMEFKRLMKGPDYALALVKKVKSENVDLFTNTTVTALHPGGKLSLTTPEGTRQLQAQRVVLCTGARESSRAQRFIGGQRPMGVMSTGALQSMIYLHGNRPFRSPVILGTELVSFSAIMTCRHLGIRPVAMIEENDRVTVRQIMRPFPFLMGVPVVFGASEMRILGQRQVEGVEYLDNSGNRQIIKADGVIVSGKFQPDSALAHMGHLETDPATGGPCIDQYGRSSDPAYFCTGNLLRPVETSSWCWQEAIDTANRVAQDLKKPIEGPLVSIPIRATHPAIKYIVPQRLTASDTKGAMNQMQIRLQLPASGHLTATSGKNTLYSKFLKSRPERRILMPLQPILKNRLDAPVELNFRGKN